MKFPSVLFLFHQVFYWVIYVSLIRVKLSSASASADTGERGNEAFRYGALINNSSNGSTDGGTENMSPILAHGDEEVIIKEETRSTLGKILGCMGFAFLSLTGITGNSLVIYAIFTDPLVQTRNQLSNLAILNLAYTDLMTTSFVSLPAAIIIAFPKYTLGPIFCRIWAVINIVGIVATMNLLMVISIDRFIAVRWPLHYPQMMSYFRLCSACGYVWFFSITCALGWGLFPCDYDFHAGICDFTWDKFGPDVPAAFWYGIACTFYLFSIPSLIILVCNAAIIHMSKVKRRVSASTKAPSERRKIFSRRGLSFQHVKEAWTTGTKLFSSNSNNSISSSSSTNSRILKGMITVITAYYLLTFPVALIRVLKLLTGPNGLSQHIPSGLTYLCTFLQFSASIVNPMIYGLLRKDFKESYRRVLRKFWIRKSCYKNDNDKQNDNPKNEIMLVSPAAATCVE